MTDTPSGAPDPDPWGTPPGGQVPPPTQPEYPSYPGAAPPPPPGYGPPSGQGYPPPAPPSYAGQPTSDGPEQFARDDDGSVDYGRVAQPWGTPPSSPAGASAWEAPHDPPVPPVAPLPPGAVVPTNGKAILSLVLGCVAVLTCFVGTFIGVAAIITGVLGKREVSASAGHQKGEGLAVSGIVIGAIATAVWGVLTLLLLLGLLIDAGIVE